MSDTPRTDAELRKPENDTGIYNGLTEFTKELERENAELLKDKERLDWLLKQGLAWRGCYKGDWLEGEWMYGNYTSHPNARREIDEAMNNEQEGL